MDPALEARAREIFAGVGMMRHLGVELVRVGPDEAEMAFVVDERHGNYLGGLHGGAVAAVVDTAVFFPAGLLPSGRRLTTEGIEIHFFRPAAAGERISVRARVLRSGRRLCTVEARALDGRGEAVAHALVTLLDLGA